MSGSCMHWVVPFHYCCLGHPVLLLDSSKTSLDIYSRDTIYIGFLQSICSLNMSFYLKLDYSVNLVLCFAGFHCFLLWMFSWTYLGCDFHEL